MTLAAVSPGLRPRRFLSSRTMISSKAPAASAPYSRWSSSRRSPGMPITPIARPDRRPCPAAPIRPALVCGSTIIRFDEIGQLAHPVDVVAVVDDDPDAADVEQVEPAGRLEERRREGPQALADVVQVRAGGPGRGRRRQGVGHVHPGPAAERGRDQVRVEHRHRPRAEPEDDQLALVGGSRQNAAPPRPA